nr:hypothetical protein [Acidianus hospitalis]
MTEEYCRRLEHVVEICEKSLNKDNEDICDIVLIQYLIDCQRGDSNDNK